MTRINSVGIIDDDPITVFGIKKLLKTMDISDSIIVYMNGKEAIEGLKEMIFLQHPVPEVLFLDINMPIMDGWQFLEEFINLPVEKKVRINIVTSSIDPHDKENWMYYREKTHHLIDYKNKPLCKTEIEAITKAA